MKAGFHYFFPLKERGRPEPPSFVVNSHARRSAAYRGEHREAPAALAGDVANPPETRFRGSSLLRLGAAPAPGDENTAEISFGATSHECLSPCEIRMQRITRRHLPFGGADPRRYLGIIGIAFVLWESFLSPAMLRVVARSAQHRRIEQRAVDDHGGAGD
jgi:hypothetical protein